MDNEYECEMMPLIVYVPDNTIALTLEATVAEKGGVYRTVTSELTIRDLYDARVEGEYWESENVKYIATNKG